MKTHDQDQACARSSSRSRLHVSRTSTALGLSSPPPRGPGSAEGQGGNRHGLQFATVLYNTIRHGRAYVDPGASYDGERYRERHPHQPSPSRRRPWRFALRGRAPLEWSFLGKRRPSSRRRAREIRVHPRPGEEPWRRSVSSAGSLEVTPSGYYAWLARADRPIVPPTRQAAPGCRNEHCRGIVCIRKADGRCSANRPPARTSKGTAHIALARRLALSLHSGAVVD